MALAGDYKQAIIEANELLKKPTLDAETKYDGACVFALSIKALKNQMKVPADRKKLLIEEFGTRAIETLTLAADAGFFKDEQAVEYLKVDSDLESIRDLPEFKQGIQAVRQKTG